MHQDSFSKEFNRLRELGDKTFVLRGSTLIVEVLPQEEIKTAGGIIIAEDRDHRKGDSVTAHRIDVARVLMTGPGYWVENPEYARINSGAAGEAQFHYEPLEVQPGAIILLAKYSTDYLSHFPGIQRPTGNKLALVKMDSVLAYYPSLEAYETAKRELNA